MQLTNYCMWYLYRMFPAKVLESFIDVGHYVKELSAYTTLVQLINSLSVSGWACWGRRAIVIIQSEYRTGGDGKNHPVGGQEQWTTSQYWRIPCCGASRTRSLWYCLQGLCDWGWGWHTVVCVRVTYCCLCDRGWGWQYIVCDCDTGNYLVKARQ